jgi:hypothetical protein
MFLARIGDEDSSLCLSELPVRIRHSTGLARPQKRNDEFRRELRAGDASAPEHGIAPELARRAVEFRARTGPEYPRQSLSAANGLARAIEIRRTAGRHKRCRQVFDTIFTDHLLRASTGPRAALWAKSSSGRPSSCGEALPGICQLCGPKSSPRRHDDLTRVWLTPIGDT